FRAIGALIGLLGLVCAEANAQRDPIRWIATWATASGWQAQGDPAFRGIKNQTLRQIVRVTAGGPRFRVVVSNVFGTAPLVIGGGGVSLHDRDARVRLGRSHLLAFGGSARVTIPAGGTATSDPVAMALDPLSELAIDLFIPGDTTALPVTRHAEALRTGYLS